MTLKYGGAEKTGVNAAGNVKALVFGVGDCDVVWVFYATYKNARLWKSLNIGTGKTCRFVYWINGKYERVLEDVIECTE